MILPSLHTGRSLSPKRPLARLPVGMVDAEVRLDAAFVKLASRTS
jgi:hypothetical protein